MEWFDVLRSWRKRIAKNEHHTVVLVEKIEEFCDHEYVVDAATQGRLPSTWRSTSPDKSCSEGHKPRHIMCMVFIFFQKRVRARWFYQFFAW